MQAKRRELLLIGASGLLTRALPSAASPAVPGPGAAELSAAVIDIPPWGRRGSNGAVAGVYAEIFRRLAQLSGCSIELRLTPIKRAVAELSSGQSDATMMLERADLNRNGIALGTVTTLEIEVWQARGSPARTLEHLAGKTVATLRGPAYHEEFDADKRIIKYQVANARQQLEMVRTGRVDGALGVRQNFLVAMRELGWDGELFSEPIWLGSRRVLLWVTPSLRDTPCAAKLGQALSQMRRSGEIDRLMAQSMQPDPDL